ncbi:DUF2515 family protein [Brevibacillus reuszeri]|uniref:DUF2515 family protein n=1 Tax=Brevibacillus reuszeri TaxID=54915 RepID=UPI00289C5414|nr:DUF2515 family protein [Brevibacillus reuszeri]
MKVPWFVQPSLQPLIKELKKGKAIEKQGQSLTGLSASEQKTVEMIRNQTTEHNGDNVDRTHAYLDFYQRRPEIRWALLAHLVSRNAGWSMTDLRGGLLPRLLSAKEQLDFFSFLERGNWLIFHDAYPQLLLYEESIKQQTNLFHLLPHLNVSAFMRAVWNHFWKKGDLDQLAIALIINEQNFLEKHVMNSPQYQRTVLKTMPFTLQELLQLNQILFPYQVDPESENQRPLRLIGRNVSHFASLSERITLGKSLYALLFRTSDYLAGIRHWAERKAHTGSRKDFWPQLFHDVNETVPGRSYQKRIVNCQIKSGESRLYSPTLRHAWKKVEHSLPADLDWYHGQVEAIHGLVLSEASVQTAEMSELYCQTLEKIELAVVARGKIFGERSF